jgi:chromosome segregation ATPase
VGLLKQQLGDSASQIAVKDKNILSLEERIQSQSNITSALESSIAQLRQKYDALEKEVALSAAHSSMLFKELQETRSKLSFSSEKVSELQEQHSGMIERVDGTAGSIQALWKEREADMEVRTDESAAYFAYLPFSAGTRTQIARARAAQS